MSIRLLCVLGLTLGLSLMPAAHATPPETAQAEIDYLLTYIEASGCKFYRNGTWYDAKRAQAHLRDKYEYLAGKDRIYTAEDFIEKAATKSSLSGWPYQVRCGGIEAVPTNAWLREVLARHRCLMSRSAGSSNSLKPPYEETRDAECRLPAP